MKTYRIKVKQVYVETMFVDAESQDDAVQLMWRVIVELLIVNINQQRQRL